MEIQLVYFEGCPGWQLAGGRLREVLRAGRDVTAPVTYQTAGSPHEDELPGFGGPPAVVVSGRDSFARPGGPAGLACRLYYPGAGGGDHCPTVRQIQAVLADAA